jgi:hypothetical protein
MKFIFNFYFFLNFEISKFRQDTPLLPFYANLTGGGGGGEGATPLPMVPLIPRTSYCNYTFPLAALNQHLMYRCYLDARWHELTALCTWLVRRGREGVTNKKVCGKLNKKSFC